MLCRSYLLTFLWTVRCQSYHAFSISDNHSTGPPSQSLGVDPVDPAVMRKPPRKKNEPVITRRFLYRVLFSASTIVLGTLFIYYIALVGDEEVSRREQTMVRDPAISSFCSQLKRGFFFNSDVHLLCFPRSCFCCPEPRSRLRAIPKQDVGLDCISVIAGSPRAGLCALHAGSVPDGSASQRGLDDPCTIGYHLFSSTRRAETLRAFDRRGFDIQCHYGPDSMILG